MIYNTREEYQNAAEEFVTLRKKGDTPILKLNELYLNLIDTEINIEQDEAINMWLDDKMSGKEFAQFFFVDCEEKSIAFLEDHVIPCAEDVVESYEQDGLQD